MHKSMVYSFWLTL